MTEMEWRKSTRCGSGACVEVSMNWKKSSRCDSGSCVEVAWQRPGRCESGTCVEAMVTESRNVYMRDSKNPVAGMLKFTSSVWSTFIEDIKADRL